MEALSQELRVKNLNGTFGLELINVKIIHLFMKF